MQPDASQSTIANGQSVESRFSALFVTSLANTFSQAYSDIPVYDLTAIAHRKQLKLFIALYNPITLNAYTPTVRTGDCTSKLPRK